MKWTDLFECQKHGSGRQVNEVIIDYTVAKECSNPEVFYTCYQCGKCGRVFEDGIMIDDGGTTIDEEEQTGEQNEHM